MLRCFPEMAVWGKELPCRAVNAFSSTGEVPVLHSLTHFRVLQVSEDLLCQQTASIKSSGEGGRIQGLVQVLSAQTL